MQRVPARYAAGSRSGQCLRGSLARPAARPPHGHDYGAHAQLRGPGGEARHEVSPPLPPDEGHGDDLATGSRPDAPGCVSPYVFRLLPRAAAVPAPLRRDAREAALSPPRDGGRADDAEDGVQSARHHRAQLRQALGRDGEVPILRGELHQPVDVGPPLGVPAHRGKLALGEPEVAVPPEALALRVNAPPTVDVLLEGSQSLGLLPL
mmetsp:Transcript_58111/g.180287  ORF Transcript_58111/g.180287 Transcript_58111/m.180287 type:complete len:207 (-) Transcript_58111:322-942(-)